MINMEKGNKVYMDEKHRKKNAPRMELFNNSKYVRHSLYHVLLVVIMQIRLFLY